MKDLWMELIAAFIDLDEWYKHPSSMLKPGALSIYRHVFPTEMWSQRFQYEGKHIPRVILDDEQS